MHSKPHIYAAICAIHTKPSTLRLHMISTSIILQVQLTK